MGVKHYFIQLYDSLVREPKLIYKYYRPFCAGKKENKGRNIFMVDGRVGHGGMFDRLKGAISVYAISKVQEKDFRIYFNFPFELQKYLEPNVYDWRIAPEDIVYSYPHSRPLFLYGECYDPRRLFKNRRCESHFYYGYNSLEQINTRCGTSFDWGTLYRELFKPTAYLQQYISQYQKEIGSDYIVVHTRFLNLLGDKVETAVNPELSDSEKEELMQKMRDAIQNIIANQSSSGEESPRLMLASDSMNFIGYMQTEMPDIYVVPGTVKHIDTAGETVDAENIKMFLDYYLISGANKVYNLVGRGMWPSAFSEYAAKIGGKIFKRIVVK